MTGHGTDKRKDAGFALITALVMLGICAALGAAYLQYMAIEKEYAQFEIGNIRARAAAQAGVHAAIAQIQKQLKDGAPVTLGAWAEPFKLSSYSAAPDGTLAKDGEEIAGTAAVTVSDEAARINVNFAPTSVLAAVLGIEPNKAREIRGKLPKIDGDDAGNSGANAQWMTAVDELVQRGLVEEASIANVDRSLLTVYTVADPANPAGFVNLNTAPAPVLAAVLGITPEAAQKAAEARPFSTVEQVAAAAGKPDPSTFNFASPADAPGTLPKQLAFSSRTFRIVSEGKAYKDGNPLKGIVQIEAVVYVDETGRPAIRYWNETRGEARPEGPTPAPEAPASAA